MLNKSVCKYVQMYVQFLIRHVQFNSKTGQVSP